MEKEILHNRIIKQLPVETESCWQLLSIIPTKIDEILRI